MRSELVSDHLIESDGRTIWVTNNQGETIARFGRGGVDIHNTHEAQLAGAPQCLICTHSSPSTAEDLMLFVDKVMELFGVKISPRHRPIRFLVRTD